MWILLPTGVETLNGIGLTNSLQDPHLIEMRQLLIRGYFAVEHETHPYLQFHYHTDFLCHTVHSSVISG